jgi:hypothetical protein
MGHSWTEKLAALPVPRFVHKTPMRASFDAAKGFPPVRSALNALKDRAMSQDSRKDEKLSNGPGHQVDKVPHAPSTLAEERDNPGPMGLGTSLQQAKPPPGWRLPPKPDPMTKGTKRGSRKHR